MLANTIIRTAIAIPACAAVLLGALIAPDFAYCERPVDYFGPSAFDHGTSCLYSTDEIVFTCLILLSALAAVAVIVSRGVDSRRPLVGALASAASASLAIVIPQVLIAGLSIGTLLEVETLVMCVVSAAIGGAASWAANRFWPLERSRG